MLRAIEARLHTATWFKEITGQGKISDAVFLRSSHRYEVSPSHLIFAGVFHYLRAQVAAFDGSQVLLVALPVAGVLVEHVWRARLCLRLDDGVPQLLGLHNASSSALLLVSEDKQETLDVIPEQVWWLGRTAAGVWMLPSVELLKRFTPTICQPWALTGTHQRPVLSTSTQNLESSHKRMF